MSSGNALFRDHHVASDALQVINSGTEIRAGSDQIDRLNAFQFAQLDDGLADHAVGGILNDDVAGFERNKVLEHAVPGSKVTRMRNKRHGHEVHDVRRAGINRQDGRVFDRDVRGYRQERALFSHGVAAPGAETGAGGDHTLANLELGADTNGIDDGNTFKSREVGQFGQVAVGSRNHVEIGWVDRGRLKLDGHLASGGSGGWYFNLGER